MFRPTVTRSAGDPHEISAGAGIGYFSLVWNIGQGLNRNIVGGPSTLTESLAVALGEVRVADEEQGAVVEDRQVEGGPGREQRQDVQDLPLEPG